MNEVDAIRLEQFRQIKREIRDLKDISLLVLI